MGTLYVAYGSNLHLEQMSHRCPSAVVYSKGKLNNWEMVFRGSKTGAHATIRRKKGKSVPVLIWTIQQSDELNLDRYEGYPFYYYKQNVMVNIGDRKRKAMVYIMRESALPGIPSNTYVNTIKKGYLDNGFDLNYLEETLYKNLIEYKKIL